MLEENILCIRINGQTIYKNIKKDICTQSTENITCGKNSASTPQLIMGVLKCKEV